MSILWQEVLWGLGKLKNTVLLIMFVAMPLSLESFLAEIHALNSKIQVIAQRMKIIERNEEIIGKTLISHNKLLRELEEKAVRAQQEGVGGPPAGEVASVLEEFKKALAANQSLITALKDEADENRRALDKLKADLLEVKYVVDNLNPVAYVTVGQVGELVDEKIRQALRSKEKKKE